MKTRVVATAIIINKGKILMGQKANNKGPYPNTWHLPGGGVRLEEESALDAIKREIKEETGLKVQKIERVGFDEDLEPDKHKEMTHYIFLIYKCESLSSVVKPQDDLVELRWFRKVDIKKIPLTRPSEKYFREIGWI